MNARATAARMSERTSSPAGARRARVHVLLISPSTTRVSPWCDALRRRHYAVAAVRDTVVARRLAGVNVPSVIVIDVTDSQLDGLELCRTLRDDGVTAPILLLHLTGTLEDLLTGFEAGADAYMRGAVEGPELFAQIGVLARRHLHGQLSARIPA